MEELRKVNADIITSINEVVKIHEEGSKRRAEATEELGKIENEGKQALLEVAQENRLMKKKKLRITFNAPVVLSLVAISFIATLLNYITAGASGRLVFMTYHSALLSPMTWIRAFTHIFGHVDWTHLIGNVSYLLLLGPMLEEKYSSQTLAAVIAITAFGTSLVNYIFFPQVALCGASGVVFAFILLSSFTSFKEGEIPITFILVAVFFIGQQIYEGITVRDNISNMAHIVGGIIGGILGFELNMKSRFSRFDR